MLYEVPLVERINQSNYIIEGEVISQSCFWDDAQQHIYTSNIVELKKRFKGSIQTNQVEIITQGGIMNDQMEVVNPSLKLKIGDIGVFFGNISVVGGTSNLLALETYASEQGFVKYSDYIGQAFDHFRRYDIEADLYYTIVRTTNSFYDEVVPFDAVAYVTDLSVKVASITSFTPTTATAGTDTQITITGTSFGTNTGSAAVMFPNADDGGATLIVTDATDIISWTTTQIVCKVPSGAGTGAIRVRDSGGTQSASSSSTLTVSYNLTNLSASGFPIGIMKNGGTGYAYKYSTSTANSGVSFAGHATAPTRFESALQTWRCNSGFNVTTPGTTTTTATPANDGEFVVMFDNTVTALPAGVLGRGHSYYTSCGSDWKVADIDIIFKRDGTGVTWYFGAATGSQPGGSSDFESVALHELGHNHQIGHTINTADVMNYNITTGTNRRTVNANNVSAGSYVISNGTGKLGSCAETPMVAFNCALPPTADFSSNSTGGCGTPQTINFTDASTGAPTSWAWDFGDGNTSTLQNPSHQYNVAGSYTVTLTSTNTNGSDAEIKTSYINIYASPTAASCSPSTIDLANAYGMGIQNVTLNGVSNTTGNAVADGGYQDFTCSKIINVTAGVSYNIDVTVGSANDEDLRVYIDFNNDGSFNETDEKLVDVSALRNSTTQNISIPLVNENNLNKILRMRVISEWNGNGITNACNDLDYGQAEDYGIVITCTTPTVDIITDKPANMAYTLPVLTNGSYYTGAGGTGTQLAAGTKITSSQTVYIYDSYGTCTDESSFDITILTILRSSECDKNHTNLSEYIYANPMTGATHYKFKVTDASMTDYFVTKTENRFRLFEASSGLAYGATYTVSVAYSTDGGSNYGPYGRACDVNVLTKLKNWYCGATSVMSDYKASYSVLGATRYKYKLVGPSETLYYTRYNSDNTFRLSWVPNIQVNTTYTVSVSTSVDGTTWSPYGQTCTITTPASGMIISEGENNFDQNLSEQDIFVNTYPNPNSGEFTVSSSNEGTFSIINELGQIIQVVSITKENNFEVKVSDMKYGIYFITGTINNEVITKKVVVRN